MMKELEDLGLSEKEARVYLASLEIGRATADQLAKHANIVRPTTYVQVKSLMEMGLMSTYEEGKKTYFAPESPSALTRLLEKKKEALRTSESLLSSMLPDLTRQFEGAGERPVVRFFTGKEGITASREDYFTAKGKDTCAIFSYESLRTVYTEDELDAYSDKRRRLGIHSRGIHVKKAYFEKAGIDPLTERRFISPEVFNFSSIDVAIYDNKTSIRSFEGALFGMIIESEQIAKGMKTIFDFLWERSERPN